MGLVTQRNQKLEKLFNDLAIDPIEKAKPKDKPADKSKLSSKTSSNDYH